MSEDSKTMTSNTTVDPSLTKDMEANEAQIPYHKKELLEAGIDVVGASKDKALDLLAANQIDFDFESDEAKRVLRKIDMRIMPMIFAIYLLQLLDKNSLSFAAIMNIKTDCNLTASQYSWLGSLVYFGYLGGDVPAAILMQRVPLAKYVACMVMIWGAIVAMHAVCKDFTSLAIVRFILGFVEVVTAPMGIYITAAFYTKKEQVTRAAFCNTASGFASILGGFFAWCIYQAPGFRWQALFIFYGTLTFGVGVILFFFFAASPTDAKWLNDHEKIIALERVRSNKTGTEVWRFNPSQLKESFLDPRFYMVFLFLVSTGLPNGGITAFGPTIIAGFGFTPAQSTLLSMGPGLATVVGSVFALIVAKYTNRTVAAVYTLVLACTGVIMMLAIPSQHTAARYGGYILTLQFPICVFFIITFITAGVGGSTKKFCFTTALQLGYAVGNLIGPQTYQAQDAPTYYSAKYTMLAFLLFTMVLFIILGSLHKFWNTSRDKQDALDAQNGISHAHVANEEFADLTDFKLRSFRYPL